MQAKMGLTLVRGARIAKRGKHVVSFNASLGVISQGAAGVILGATLASVSPQAAWAEQCGTLNNGVEIITCDAVTYDVVNAAPISYVGAFTNPVALRIVDLTLDFSGLPAAVQLSSTGNENILIELDSGTSIVGRVQATRQVDDATSDIGIILNGASVSGQGRDIYGLEATYRGSNSNVNSSIIINSGNIDVLGGVASSGELTDSSGAVSRLIGSFNEGAATITLNGSSVIRSEANQVVIGALSSLDGNENSADAIITMNDNSRIELDGRGNGKFGFGAAALNFSSNSTVNQIVTLNDNASIELLNFNAPAVPANAGIMLWSGYNTGTTGLSYGEVALNNNATVTTSGGRTSGVRISTPLTGQSAEDTGSTVFGGSILVALRDAAEVVTNGVASPGILIEEYDQRGSTYGDTRRSYYDAVSIELSGSATVNTLGEDSHGIDFVGDVLDEGSVQVAVSGDASIRAEGLGSNGIRLRPFSPASIVNRNQYQVRVLDRASVVGSNGGIRIESDASSGGLVQVGAGARVVGGIYDGAGATTVTVAGTVIGDIDLGGGDDILRVPTGIINGLISGGDGSDTLILPDRRSFTGVDIADTVYDHANFESFDSYVVRVARSGETIDLSSYATGGEIFDPIISEAGSTVRVSSDLLLSGEAIDLNGTTAIAANMSINSALVRVGSLTLNNSAIFEILGDQAVISGTISGVGGVRQSGVGVTTLSSGLNIFGPLRADSGTLNVLSASSVGDVVLQAGSILNLSAPSFSSGVAAIDGIVNVQNDLSWYFTDTTVTDAITGTGSINVATGSTLQFIGSGSLPGGLTITGAYTVAALPVADNVNPSEVTAGSVVVLSGNITSTVPTPINGIAIVDSVIVDQRPLTGTGQVQILTGQSYTVAQDEDSEFSGLISGAGDFIKSGTGALRLTGDNTALTGAITISGGALDVDGIVRSDIVIEQNGRLEGSGTVGRVTSSGVIAPGNSPGTLTPAGDVIFNATSIYELDVDGLNYTLAGGVGSYDRIALNDPAHTFTIDGTLTPILRGITGAASNTFTPEYGNLFTIITTANPNGVSGTFATVAQPADGLPANARFDVLYFANRVDAVVTPDSYATFAGSFVGTSNAESFGSALDVVRPAAGANPDTAIQTLFTNLYPLNGTQLASAFGALSGEVHAFAVSDARDSVETLSSNSYVGGLTPQARGRNAWADLSFDQVSYSADQVVSSYESTSQTLWAGLDLEQSSDLRYGFAFGRTWSEVGATSSGSVSGETTMLMGYYAARYNRLSFGATVGIGRSSFDTQRSVGLGSGVETAIGSGDAEFASVSFETAYQRELAPNMNGNLWADVSMIFMDVGGYSETGSALISSAVSEDSYSSGVLEVGYEITVTPTFVADGTSGLTTFGFGLRHEFGSDRQYARRVSMHGAEWDVASHDLSPTSAFAAVGFNYDIGDGQTISGHLSGEGNQDYSSYGAALSFVRRF